MTANQISYAKLVEDYRSHRAQEDETRRSNLAREREQARGNTLNYEASIYSAQASMRNTDVNAETARRNTDVNAATSLQVAGINAATQMGVAQLNADTARYSTDKRYSETLLNIAHDSDIKTMQQGETVRHNKAVEAETARHQKRQDRSTTWGNIIGAGKAVGGMAIDFFKGKPKNSVSLLAR